MFIYSFTFILSTKSPSRLKVKPLRARRHYDREARFTNMPANQVGFQMRVIDPGLHKFQIRFEPDSN